MSPREQQEALALLKALPMPFQMERFLHPRQLAFVRDPSKWKTAVCSRRAGKTVGAAAALLGSASRHPDSVSLYITRSRKNAKQLIWGTLKTMNRQHQLGGVTNEAELSLTMPNGARIYLSGAHDRDAIEDFRGHGMALAVIDEAQSLPPYLSELVDAVLVPALMDFDGTLILIGTPAPVPVGYYFEASHSPAWSHHAWTVFDNPHIERKSGKPPRLHLEAELSRRGLTVEDPIIQREWFGVWAHDPDSLVFRYDAGLNSYTELPTGKDWEYVIGVDLGYEDADAISVLGWHADSPQVWQVEEHVVSKQTISGLGETLGPLVERYAPLSTVVDTGGLGKKIAEELTARLGIPLKAAEKARKAEYIELVNDALRSGRLLVKAESRFAQDAMLVEWDRVRSTPERRVISERYHSDIGDALLYAFRESLHWLHEPVEAPPEPGTEAHAHAMAERMEREAEEQAEAADEWFSEGEFRW